MKIVVVAIGTRGDVEPHSALCEGLLTAGYDAQLCAPNDLASDLAARNLPFHPIPVSFRQLCGDKGGDAMLNSGGNGIRFLRNLRRVAIGAATKVIAEIRAACEGADAVCYSPLGLAARYFAREMDIPAFATALQPLGRTGTYPNPLLSLPDWAPCVANRLSYRLVEQAFWQLARPLLKCHMRNRLPLGGNFDELYERPVPGLFGYSPLVVPRPGDWKPWMHTTGYWTSRPVDWQPPPELEEFLAEAPAVCVGFGSMNSRRIGRIMKITVEALAAEGRRAVILTGWSGYAGQRTGRNGNVFMTDAAPHSWLFPRVSAVVHHGGAGTSAAALRAGIPSVILPFFFDQSFWGRWLAARGLGPPPISFHSLSVASVARALGAAKSHDTQSRLQQLSVKLRQEDGVGNAVAIITEALENRAGTSPMGQVLLK